MLLALLYSIRNQHDSEIGTGFYVEKKPSETTDFLDRKLKIVDANSENITKAVQATRYVQIFDNVAKSISERIRIPDLATCKFTNLFAH